MTIALATKKPMIFIHCQVVRRAPQSAQTRTSRSEYLSEERCGAPLFVTEKVVELCCRSLWRCMNSRLTDRPQS